MGKIKSIAFTLNAVKIWIYYITIYSLFRYINRSMWDFFIIFIDVYYMIISINVWDHKILLINV